MINKKLGKIYIITGHYGSGKSEFSVNFAYYLKKTGKEVVLADLDIVNPYFRSREVRDMLNNDGIEVVADILNSTKGLDMPYLSPAIKGLIVNSPKDIILDCGGDDVGIRVLRQFYTNIIDKEYEVYMIINVFRPLTNSVEQIIEMKDTLEVEANLKVNFFINNSNFLRQTTVEDMLSSDRILSEVSHQTKIPIKYVCGIKKLVEKLPDNISGEKFTLMLSLRNDWL